MRVPGRLAGHVDELVVELFDIIQLIQQEVVDEQDSCFISGNAYVVSYD